METETLICDHCECEVKDPDQECVLCGKTGCYMCMDLRALRHASCVNDGKWAVGDRVSWTRYGRNTARRCQGIVKELVDGGFLARLRRGDRGKKDYFVEITELHPEHGNPMKALMSDLRAGMKGGGT